ncbi:urease accessory protein UreF [Bacillus chungangensis]|uniref:Urease accessory protein UreF n=1 Tax=Bacillus chungangensis TaxID=587633 RepID=A0ABT9WNN6_9BACI|nr:urease accessory protein UreF [Bacillus chungangensis]MDQ0174893.1 urease accessory protein [Bacillus chungangensis]
MNARKEGLKNRLNIEDISINFRLLHLFQIHDSAFPIGSFTQSFGMETYIQQDRIKTKQQLIDYCQVFLDYNLVHGDGIVVKAAFEAAKEEDWERLIHLEQLCHGMKLASESRAASMKMGRQFLHTVMLISQLESLTIWKQKLDAKEVKGHYPLIYGLYASGLNIDQKTMILTFLYASISAIVQNAVRAIPLGQNSGVQAIYELLSSIEKAAGVVMNCTLDDISNNTLGIEMSSMEHEYLYSRLFIS